MKKVVIVTGANSGIGKATAALFAQKGYRVAISARRIEELNKVQKELADGAEVAAISADVSLAKDVEHLVQAVVAKWGQIDVLIHAAGVIYSGTLLETDEKTWDYILDINLKGTYLVNRSVLEQMVSQGYGSIVNIASDAGLLGGRNLAAYCAAKGGVVLLTKAIALDHIRQGVRVNALCPGPVNTPMTAGLSDAEMEHWQKFLPIQRFANPDEVAESAYFLAHSEYMVGSCLTIDGGNTAGGAI